MIRAYSDFYLPEAESKLGTMLETATDVMGMTADEFFARFLASPVCRAFESGDPVLVLGKSAAELLALLLGGDPVPNDAGDFASPEYWAGYTLAYMQWYFNKPFASLLAAFPAQDLLADYFPYHEMDIRQSVDLFTKKIAAEPALKRLRRERRLSQTDLAVLSDVPVRSIRAYEQGTVDIRTANAGTLYSISKTLGCTIEDLLF